jgi:hypothetical protein
LRQAFAKDFFEVSSGSFDKVTCTWVRWVDGPSEEDVRQALAPLTADGDMEACQLEEEDEFSSRRRLVGRAADWTTATLEFQLDRGTELGWRRRMAGRAADQTIAELTLEDTPETIVARLIERLRELIPPKREPP